jgi:hypothetical protein
MNFPLRNQRWRAALSGLAFSLGMLACGDQTTAVSPRQVVGRPRFVETCSTNNNGNWNDTNSAAVICWAILGIRGDGECAEMRAWFLEAWSDGRIFPGYDIFDSAHYGTAHFYPDVPDDPTATITVYRTAYDWEAEAGATLRHEWAHVHTNATESQAEVWEGACWSEA